MRNEFLSKKAQSKVGAEARKGGADREELAIKSTPPRFEPTDLRPLRKLFRLFNQLG